MRVQFDLRPAEYLERERKRHSFSIARILAVLLLFAFLFSSIFYIAKAFFETQVLQSENEILEGELADLDVNQMALTAEIGRLRAREEQFRKTLGIMQNEPTTLEVLNALETHMAQGMGVNLIRFAAVLDRDKKISCTVTVEATALTEEQIIALTDGLSGSGLFSSVTMPSTKKDESTGRVSFSLALDARPFGQGVSEGGQP